MDYSSAFNSNNTMTLTPVTVIHIRCDHLLLSTINVTINFNYFSFDTNYQTH